jgi:dipeptidyl aminopeptidase/acylaminoacyl peptidase
MISLRHRDLGLSASVLLLVSTSAPAATLDDALLLRSAGKVQIAPGGGGVAFVVERSDVAVNRVETTVWLLARPTDPAPPPPIPVADGEQPRWSPDGQRLAFLSARGDRRAVWIAAADGSGPTEAVRAPADIERFAWLPDGSGVLFTMRTSGRTVPGDDVRSVGAGAGASLYRQRVDAAPERLTPGPHHVSEFDVARGPDGRTRVVFTSQPSPSVRDGRLSSDLRLLDPQTGEVRSLVARPGLDSSPRFSPDGTVVAFVSMNGVADWLGNYHVSIVRIDGTGLRSATAHPPGLARPQLR